MSFISDLELHIYTNVSAKPAAQLTHGLLTKTSSFKKRVSFCKPFIEMADLTELPKETTLNVNHQCNKFTFTVPSTHM